MSLRRQAWHREVASWPPHMDGVEIWARALGYWFATCIHCNGRRRVTIVYRNGRVAGESPCPGCAVEVAA